MFEQSTFAILGLSEEFAGPADDFVALTSINKALPKEDLLVLAIQLLSSKHFSDLLDILLSASFFE